MQLWFYAIFLFTTSRHGVSAKELQRQLGVTYKTAWRIAARIREHMATVDGEAPIGGEGKIVEVDETFYGGKKKGTGGHWRKDKAVVMGMLERDGDIMLKVVDNQKAASLMPPIIENVKDGSEVHTDELKAYENRVGARFTHKTVNHGKQEYVGPDGETTNSIESFFSHLKRSIAGTHTNVSHKHLQRYVKEFEYRFNRRTTPEVMLDELLSRFPELDA